MCDVCRNREKTTIVVSSALGPVSWAYCSDCYFNHAEPEVAFTFTYESCGTEVAEWVKDLTTYVDGKYLTWNEWVEINHG